MYFNAFLIRSDLCEELASRKSLVFQRHWAGNRARDEAADEIWGRNGLLSRGEMLHLK